MDWRGLRRVGETEAVDKPEVHSTEAECVEIALMMDIRCLPTVLNCHVC